MKKAPRPIVQYDKTLPYIEDREPHLKPDRHLIKDGENSYKVVLGRRPSEMLLVNKLRSEVDDWRDKGYPGVTETTKELLNFWFENDHIVNGEKFRFWFCQREAIETLVYLFEVKKFKDLKPLVENYSQKFRRDLLGPAVEVVEDIKDRRKVIRYFSELEQVGEQDLPQENLLRYAFKMATGSGKTIVMALACVWSYFNKRRERKSKSPDNFLIIAPNVIVFERLAKDFRDNKIFYELPLIPPTWLPHWDVKVTLRGDTSPLKPSGNIIIDNIHQIYESKEARETGWTPENVVEAMLGRKPQKDLTKTPVSLLAQIKKLDNLIVLNDEAHHVHEEELEWHKTLMSIHNSLPDGLTLWLDFSATPKDQNGAYFPWIIVDYPLAQAVEDRIVKAPLIVHRIDRKDPEKVNRDNVVQKYGDWIVAALERWKDHFVVYEKVGKKSVLFIMAEKNDYADRIAERIRNFKKELDLRDPAKEVLVIHTDRTGEVRKSDLDDLRKEARDIDLPESKVKIIVSVMMLKEGWDVQNVSIILGLRPFTAKAQILPEQSIGRGLRLMRGISPDHTQTLEAMGTQAFEEFVKELEKEGVGVNTVKTPPPLPVTITGKEKSRRNFDIEIPNTEFRYARNYKNISILNPLEIPSLYHSDKLAKERKITLRMEFPITETEVHVAEISPGFLETGRELLSYITNEVMKRARFTCNFQEIYPFVEKYVSEKCFEIEVNIESDKVRQHLKDIVISEAIIDLLAKELGKATVEQKETVLASSPLILSKVEPFAWRRKHLRCEKTIFNFVAVYNDFEAEFSQFLDKCKDIDKFAALAERFKVDYLSSRGAIRFYYPDFVAVQKINNKKIINWIIETKGREYEETDRKDATIRKWCEDVSKQSKFEWRFIKVLQSTFNSIKNEVRRFEDLVKIINSEKKVRKLPPADKAAQKF